MNEERLWLRLRGGYAILAGILLLVGIPVFQGAVLAPTGYIAAVNAIVAHQQFGPLLSWTAAHPAESRLFRVFEVIPFLLALGLPGPLRTILWAEDPRGRRAGAVVLWAGRVGFVLFVAALFVGMFTSAAAASAFVGTTDVDARQAIALDYAGRYALETLLSRVLGGIGVTVFILAVSLRVAQTRLLPRWYAFLGVLAAALVATNALLFALAPTQASTPTAGITFAALALWLLAAGALLIRISTQLAGSSTEASS